MNEQEFLNIVEDVVYDINKVLCKKAKEYATETDRLHNFNEAGKFLDCSNVFALAGMMNKHIVSVYDIIKNYEKNRQLPSVELLNEKIGDSINYLILLKACMMDKISKGGTNE